MRWKVFAIYGQARTITLAAQLGGVYAGNNMMYLGGGSNAIFATEKPQSQ